MNWIPLHHYDLAMLGVLVFLTLFGAYRGMARQAASLVTVVASSIACIKFSGPLAPFIGFLRSSLSVHPRVFSKDDPWNHCLAMLVLFIVTALAVTLLFRMVMDAIVRLRLESFDRHAGAVVGLVKGVLLCIVFTFFAVTMSKDYLRPQVLHSYSGKYISIFLRDAAPILPEKVRGALRQYIDEFQRDLQDGPESRRPKAEGRK